MQGKVELCGVNTASLRVLTQAQMASLLLQAKNGDDNARQLLIEGNLRLVLSVIQRFEKRGESPDDLFQVGCIGLMKAIANFDPTKGLRFSTYGVPTIVECRENVICVVISSFGGEITTFLCLYFGIFADRLFINQIAAKFQMNIYHATLIDNNRFN